MLTIDKPSTVIRRNSQTNGTSNHINLLNDVLIFSYSYVKQKANVTYEVPYEIRHTEKVQCKEFSFTPRVWAKTAGKDYSVISVDNLDEDTWDDSMFFSIPSGTGNCGDTSCKEYEYHFSVHTPNYHSSTFEIFFKLDGKFTMVALESMTNITSLGRPYENCSNKWPEEVYKLKEDLQPNLLRKYSLNECISKFRFYNITCNVECTKEVYTIGKKFVVPFSPNVINQFFQLENASHYTHLEIVFKSLKKRIVQQYAAHTTVQLLGTLGGLLGLYMGISLISVCEIVHFSLVFVMEVIKRLLRRNTVQTVSGK